MSEKKSRETTNHTSPQKITTSLIVSAFALLIALGTAFLTVENWLTQNKLSLWSNTLPNIISLQVKQDLSAPLEAVNRKLSAQEKVSALILAQQKESAAPSAKAQSELYAAFARLSLLAGNEPAQVIPLLKAAKQALIGTPYNTSIQKINSDIKQLQTARTDSLQTVLTQISQMQSLLPTLISAASIPKAAIKNQEKVGWTTRLSSHLKNLFVIKRDHTSPAFLSAEQANLLKMHLSIQLDILAWASIHNQAPVYQSTLDKIKKTLARGFSKNTALSQLQKTVITLNKPLIFFDRSQLDTAATHQGVKK